MIKTEDILNNVTTREGLIDRVEVLEKIKDLLLIPGANFTTIQGVADFYEVNADNIRTNIMTRHRGELESDGLISLSKKEILERYCQNETDVIKHKSHIEIKLDNDKALKIGNGKNLLFSRRAVLRVGMLLRESEVAREVRTQLLNIEEKADKKIKIESINDELALFHQSLGEAFLNNDLDKFSKTLIAIHEANRKCHQDEFEMLKEENNKLMNMLSDLTKTIEDMENTNKILDEQVNSLSKEIEAVAQVETYRKTIIIMMNKIARKLNQSSPASYYQQLYKELYERYGINLSERRYVMNSYEKQFNSKIDYIETLQEWTSALSVAKEMCLREGVDLQGLDIKIDNVIEMHAA